MHKILTAFAALALLSACEVDIGKDKRATRDVADAPKGSASASSGDAGQVGAEDGQLSIDAPGFKMKLDIPKGIADRTNFDSDSGVLYPGAALSGLHVEARERSADSSVGDQSVVELRFSSGDPPTMVAAWYRDPARVEHFTIASVARRGDGYAIRGVEKENGKAFGLRLTPRNAGTEGVLMLRDRS